MGRRLIAGSAEQKRVGHEEYLTVDKNTYPVVDEREKNEYREYGKPAHSQKINSKQRESRLGRIAGGLTGFFGGSYISSYLGLKMYLDYLVSPETEITIENVYKGIGVYLILFPLLTTFAITYVGYKIGKYIDKRNI